MEFLEERTQVEASSQALMAAKRYSSPENYSQEFPKQMTGLHLAAYFGVEKTVEDLLQKRVDIDSRDTYGRTPLSWAAENGHEAVVGLLLATGKVDADSKDTLAGWTPLSWAAENGHEAIVRLLLTTGKVDADSKDTLAGQTPLSRAARNGHDAIVKLLLTTGKVDADSKDTDSRTPLWWAAANGHEAVVKLLLAISKVDADSKDIYGRTPLSRAAANSHKAIVKLLLVTGKVDADSKYPIGRLDFSHQKHLAVGNSKGGSLYCVSPLFPTLGALTVRRQCSN